MLPSFNCKISDKTVPYVLIYKKVNREIDPYPLNSYNNISDQITDESSIVIESPESPNTFKIESELVGTEKDENKEINMSDKSSTIDFFLLINHQMLNQKN